MNYYAYPIGAELVAFGIWCLFMAMCWATFKLLIWAGPKIAAVWQSRGTVAEVPEDFDEHVDEALRQAADDLADALDAVIDTEAALAEVKRRAAEAEHFEQWKAELESRPRIRQHLRRMERGSR